MAFAHVLLYIRGHSKRTFAQIYRFMTVFGRFLPEYLSGFFITGILAVPNPESKSSMVANLWRVGRKRQTIRRGGLQC